MPYSSARVGQPWKVVAESAIMLSLSAFLPSDVDWVSESLLNALLPLHLPIRRQA